MKRWKPSLSLGLALTCILSAPIALAQQQQPPPDELKKDIEAGKQAEQIRKNIAEGQKAVVPGTPVFLLAYTDPTSSKVKTVARLTGAQPFSIFKNRIDQLLAEQLKAGAEAAEKPK